MEPFEYYLESIIGLVIIPLVTEGLKNWFKIEMPAIKFIIVAVLASGVSYGLGQLYPVELTWQEFLFKALMMSFAAIFGKTLAKTKKEKS